MRAMRIVFFSTSAPVGGHLRSALTIADALRARGHEISFITGDGPGTHLIRAFGFEHLGLSFTPSGSLDFDWRDFNQLRAYVASKRPHVLHSFLKGIPQLAILARSNGAKLVATICGGQPQRHFSKMSPITVFSQELKDWLSSVGIPGGYIHLIPGRISIVQPPHDTDVLSFRQKFFLSEADPVVMMICRTDRRKKPALDAFFRAAQIWGERHKEGIFVHIGSGNEPETENRIRSEAEAINKASGRVVLISTDFGSNDPAKYLHLATIAVGMGRSAFESMLLGKATLILSNEGFGGIVCEETISGLSQHNFTGRSSSYNQSSEERSKELVRSVEELVMDPDRLSMVGLYGKQYCENNLDVLTAATQYEELYFDKNAKFILPNMEEILYTGFREVLRTYWYKIRQ